MGLASEGLAASGLLCIIIKLGHLGRSGLPSEVELFLMAGTMVSLASP